MKRKDYLEKTVQKFLCTAYHLIAKKRITSYVSLAMDGLIITVGFKHSPELTGDGYIRAEYDDESVLTAWTGFDETGMPYSIDRSKKVVAPNYRALATALLRQANRA